MKTNYPWTLAVNGIKRILAGLGLAVGVMLTQPVMAAGPAPVDLGSAARFTILAGAAVTTTGGGAIDGDVGASPITGAAIGIPAAQVNGTIYAVDNAGPAGSVMAPVMLTAAKGDLTTAYNDAAGRTPEPTGPFLNPNGGNIGGMNLGPGLYKFTSWVLIRGTDITLTGGADDVWIFQIASGLEVGSGIKVILAGGAQAKNIFWQVGSSAVLDTFSVFKGTIMADQSITMKTSSTMQGRALAFEGGVTFNGTSGGLPSSSQVITNFIPTNGSVFAGTNKVGLSAQASSGLPVSFAVKSGPGVISGGTNLVFVNTGLVSIVASQAGNTSYRAAPNVTNTFTVIPPLSAWLVIQVIPTNGSWRLTVPAGYTGPKAGTGNLAAVSAVAGEYRIAYGALSGYMAPTNNNQAQFVVAGVTSLFAGVYRQVSTNLAPPVVTATEGTYTNKVGISWPSVPGVIGYEIWKSQANDVNTAVRIVETPDFQYDDADVVPVRSYYYWGLSKTATQVSPMSLVILGYASLAPDPNAGTADIIASDMVYLPVNATNFTPAGTVSFWLKNLGPDILNSAEVAFDFRIGTDTAMLWLGTDQRAFNLAVGQEQLVILTAQAKRNLVVPATLSGVQQVQVTVRHASTLIDPNVTNNTTTAAGTVRVRAAGVNSPGRSVNDYDGDGKSDECLYQSALGRWHEELSGMRYAEYVGIGDVGMGWTPVPGDYDGDGVTDVAAYERSSGQWLALQSSNGQIISGQFGGPGYTAAQGDFDGDSMTDPAVYRASDGTWYAAASSEEYAIKEAFLGGIGYEPVVRDYDGDGLADPAVYNQTTGLWAISLSGRDYHIMTGTFGGSGYLPVSADYDGDGLVDPAIYKPSTAEFQVLLSGSPATQGDYTWWGGVVGNINGTLVPADYDGDGKADLAVYHQDTSVWELFLSTQDYQLWWAPFGGPAYAPVTE